MTSARPPGSERLLSLSLDLDNKWSYLKTHGDPGWEAFPSYLDALSHVVLGLLEQHGLKITFFVVGQDAARPENAEALRAIAQAGHEIGNHSFRHEPWFQDYSRAEAEREIADAEEHILRVTGQRPIGFRGPGFSFTDDVIDVLAHRGYLYDASSFPTFLGPLARLYYFWKSGNLSPEERAKRRQLFGRLRDGFRPNRPFLWARDGWELVELPVTTMPVFRLPMHLSYILYLSQFNRALARSYLRSAMTLCRLGRVTPSMLLHPLDFLGGDRVSGLDFFPAMRTPTARKLEVFSELVSYLKRHFRIVNMKEHALAVREARGGRRELRVPANGGAGGGS